MADNAWMVRYSKHGLLIVTTDSMYILAWMPDVVSVAALVPGWVLLSRSISYSAAECIVELLLWVVNVVIGNRFGSWYACMQIWKREGAWSFKVTNSVSMRS
jgi:hypothetical protein